MKEIHYSCFASEVVVDVVGERNRKRANKLEQESQDAHDSSHPSRKIEHTDIIGVRSISYV